ncbi:MAG: glycosyltransferase family 2 protein [Formosimonas sp.]
MSEQVWAISMFKDEADVAEHVIKHLIDEGVDGIIVADNLSTDETQQKLLACRDYARERNVQLIVQADEEVGYYQSKKMSALAAQAAALGASWIVPFDADEIWYSDVGRLGDTLKSLVPEIRVAQCVMLNHFATDLDAAGESPFESLQWRLITETQTFPKVAFRWEEGAVIHMGNHGVDLPHGGAVACVLACRHFPFRSFAHFKDKAFKGKKAFDAAADLPVNQGLHWREYGRVLAEEGEAALLRVFESNFYFKAPESSGLMRDPAPFRRFKSL